MILILLLIVSALLSALILSPAHADNLLLDRDETISRGGSLKQELLVFDHPDEGAFLLEYRLFNMGSTDLTFEPTMQRCMVLSANGAEIYYPWLDFHASSEYVFEPLVVSAQEGFSFSFHWDARDRDRSGEFIPPGEYHIVLANSWYGEPVELSCTVNVPNRLLVLQDKYHPDQIDSLFYRALDYLQRDGFLADFGEGYFDGSTMLNEFEKDQAIKSLKEEMQSRRDLLPHQLLLISEISSLVQGDGLRSLPLSWEKSLLLLLGDGEFSDLAVNISPVEEARSNWYDDVPLEHWAYEVCNHFVECGLLEGYPEGFFSGGRTLTRYEFTQVVARLMDAVEQAGDPSSVTAVEFAALQGLKAEFAEELKHITLVTYGH